MDHTVDLLGYDMDGPRGEAIIDGQWATWATDYKLGRRVILTGPHAGKAISDYGELIP